MFIPRFLTSLKIGLAIAVSGLFIAPAPAAAESSPVIDFSKTDPAMEAAKAKARVSLSPFWDAYAAPRAGEEGFVLKVGFPTYGTNTEHIWISDAKRVGAGR